MPNYVDAGTAYLAVDCSRSFAHDLRALYGALGRECLAKQPVRVLVKATHADKGDPTDHLALRDALTLMIMTGVAADLRLALVADAPALRRAFLALRSDLQQLGIRAAVCEDDDEAWDWLGTKRPAAQVAAATADVAAP
jgi:hypothetical protein